MRSFGAGLACALVLVGCADQRPGAVRLRAPGVTGDLVVDGASRGPVQDEQVIELAPGGHRVAIWRGHSEIVASIVEVRSAMIVDVAVDPAQLPPEIAVGAPPDPMPPEPVAVPVPVPVPEPVPEPVAVPVVPRQLEGASGAPTDAILPVLLQRSGELREACAARARGPARVDLRIHVRADGSVDRVSTEGPAPAPLTACVQREARRWRFPALGDDAEVEMPIVFGP